MSDWREHERRINDEKRRQWNFDFENEQPLPGRWQWERVSGPCQLTPPGTTVDRRSDDATPTATASPPTDKVAPPPVSSGSTTSAVESPCQAETVTPTCSAEPRRKRRRQTTLTGE